MILSNFFATVSLFFGFVAISSLSAHTSVYFMIITFLSTGILYYLLSSTYVSMILFIVYVGAVAMLFVFCVMLLSLQSDGFVGRIQYFSYTALLVFIVTFIFYFFGPHYIFSTDYFTFDLFDFMYTFYTKDTVFLSTFYSFYTPYIVFLGMLLFFVTVSVTILLGLFFKKMFLLDFIVGFYYFFNYYLFSVHFSEPLGYWMMYFVDVYFAAFYYLTLIVVFVFWSTFSIVWQFHYKLFIDPSEADVVNLRYELIPFRKVTHNETLEFWWTVIPSVIIFFIALPALILLYAIDTPLGEPVLTVKAVGHQWYWSYEYTDKLDKNVFPGYENSAVFLDSYMVPETDLTLGQKRLLQVDKPIVLPIETQIRVIVTAMDVLHSWAVPSLGVKIDAIPGRLNQFYLYLPVQGVYYGQCSEICGPNHGFMPISLYAVKPEIFVEWYLKTAIKNAT